MQLSLPNYLNLVQQNLMSLGVDHNVIYTASASNAMLISHGIINASYYASIIISIPGNSLPANNSNEAPPPVEI